jgi:hypothetical protein
MPEFTRFQGTSKQIRGCSGCNREAYKSTALQEVLDTIKRLPEDRLTALKRLLKMPENQKFVYFEVENRKFVRREL